MNSIKLNLILAFLFFSCSKESTNAQSTKDITFKSINYTNSAIKTFDTTNLNIVDTLKINLNDTIYSFLTIILAYIPPSSSDYTLGVSVLGIHNKLDFAYYTGSGSQKKVKYLNTGDNIGSDNLSWYSDRGTTTVLNPSIMCSYVNASSIPGGGIKLYDIFDKEEAYIPFRFYSKIGGVVGWRYGWIRCKSFGKSKYSSR
jgi:hypothetical protein